MRRRRIAEQLVLPVYPVEPEKRAAGVEARVSRERLSCVLLGSMSDDDKRFLAERLKCFVRDTAVFVCVDATEVERVRGLVK